MKKAIFFLVMVAFLCPTFANAAYNNSLRFWLVLDQPLPGDIHPGGAVLIGANPIFDSDETTVEAWFKPTSYATGTGEDEGRTILWNGDGTAGHDPYWIYIDQYGYLVARVAYESPYQGQIIKSANPISLNVWHHFALVISLTETSLYLDGEKQPDVVLNAGSACKGTSYLALGRSMWHWNPYEGLIDEMRIWSTARTEAEILSHMFAGEITGSETGLISYWDFEPIASPSVLQDLTSNGINGIVEGPIWTQENSPFAFSIIIDIKPGAYPNSIQLGAKGSIPVAILTTAEFNANTVSSSTVRFAEASPTRWKMQDVDGDGDLDMVLYFNTQDLDLSSSSTSATLTGKTINGINIQGRDSVVIVTKGKK